MFINRLRRHAGLFFRTHAADLVCLGILTATVAFTAIQNRLPPGTILMGWDNLNPELNLGLNIKRALFSVWQEYQGLGLLAGHGHAADLPRQLILTALSPVIPTNLLRWSWVMGMLAAGAFGVYALLRLKVRAVGALLGSVFAITNLGTLQIFYTPFEPFITQFGTTPWLLLTFLLSVRTNKRVWFLALAITSLVAAPQGFVQTVFFASLFLLAILSVFLIAEGHQNMSTRVKRVFAFWSIVLAVNAFWLLPSAYFIATGSRVTVEAKINQMSTEEVYLRNRAFGSLWDTVQLKGFWFDTFDFDPGKSGIAPIYGFWRAYAGHPVVEGAILLLFTVVLLGAVALIAKHKKEEYWLLGAFIVVFTLLTIDTSPFSWINDWLSRVPLFHQAYRIRFTKIASLASILYSLLFGIGSSFLLEKVGRIRGRAVLTGAMLGIIAGCFALVSAPIAQGNLFYPVVIRSLPQEYPELFSYFQKKPADGRIAVMPQPTYWGWKYYQWGYTGWGFLWYGIENPIMDRAFDPWSGYNENYYWEISRSIYSKNPQSMLAVLTKYDVRYVLLDENVISPSHNRALFTEEIKAMLATLPQVREMAWFGKLTVYERAGASQSFISLSPALPLVFPSYRWTDNDEAYGELGDYIATKKSAEADFGDSGLSGRMNLSSNNTLAYSLRNVNSQARSGPDGNRTRGIELDRFIPDQPGPTQRVAYQSSADATITYPFRSLFTKRSASEREFTITETPEAITIDSMIEATSASILKADALVYDSTKSADLRAENVKPCGVARDGTVDATATDQGLRFTSYNQRGCLSFDLGNLPHTDGYLVAVESRHVTGRPLLFSLINQTAKHVELETYLPNNSPLPPLKIRGGEGELTPWTTSYFILPPLAPDGLGYTVYLSNDAIGRQETINDITSIKIYRIPYQEIVMLRSGLLTSQPQGRALSVETVAHPNPAYYRVSLQPTIYNPQPTTLILSQSFDPGWTAWEWIPTFPYVRKLNDHVLVNNWANGWRLETKQNESIAKQAIQKNTFDLSCSSSSSCSTIVLFFWPQLLQWLGFALLPVPFLFLLLKRLKK